MKEPKYDVASVAYIKRAASAKKNQHKVKVSDA